MRLERTIGFLAILGLLLSWSPVSFADSPIGLFRNTYYLLLLEEDFPASTPDASLLDLQGGVLAQVTALYKRRLDIEGSGKLRDGRVLNFAGRVNGQIRYEWTVHPFGRGVGDCELVPFHTLAADPARIPLGSVVRIAETTGMLLPDGTLHDGLWRAEDIGGAIQGDRIDLFVGAGDQGAWLDRAGIGHLQPLTVSLVSPPPREGCVQQVPH